MFPSFEGKPLSYDPGVSSAHGCQCGKSCPEPGGIGDSGGCFGMS